MKRSNHTTFIMKGSPGKQNCSSEEYCLGDIWKDKESGNSYIFIGQKSADQRNDPWMPLSPTSADLENLGIIFRYTALGAPVFIKAGNKSVSSEDSVHALNWTPDQLEIIAQKMRNDPDCCKMLNESSDPTHEQ